MFSVLDDEQRGVGSITAVTLRVMSPGIADMGGTLAAALMQPVVSVQASDDLRTATERMVSSGLRELPRSTTLPSV